MTDNHEELETVNITVPARVAYLHIVMEATRNYAAMVGFSEDDIYKVILSVEETVTNIINHSFVCQEASPTFDISFSISDPYGISIRIDDKGIPFDPSKLPVYDSAKVVSDMDISGLGLQLIRGMMDQVEYRILGREGKETLLIKYCSMPHLDQNRMVVAPADNARGGEEIQGPIEYSIRRLNPDEAIEVSRGAYKSHGYTFFNDVIYYPEQIRDLNDQDLMISAVAVTRRNEFMGHGALLLSEPGARTGDLDFFFVDPKFRKQNRLGSQLLEFLMKTAMEMNMAGVYGYSVTVHTISQKMAAKTSLQPLAILLATSPMTWDFKGITGHLNQRISVVLGFKYLSIPEPRVIYLPKRHEEMIRGLYASLNVGHRFENAEAAPDEDPAVKTVLQTEIAEVENSAEIRLIQAGNDLAGELHSELRKLCISGIDAIALGVSLENGTASRYLDLFEGMGFFFAGVFPETPMGDVLILQYLNNLDFDYAAVNILPGQTETLLNYIRCHDPSQGA